MLRRLLDSASVWHKILHRIVKHTTSQGHEILEEIGATLVDFNKAFLTDDNPSISVLYAKIGKLYHDVVPNIQNNNELVEAISYTGNECKDLASKFHLNNATMKDVDNLSKIAAKKIISSLN